MDGWCYVSVAVFVVVVFGGGGGGGGVADVVVVPVVVVAVSVVTPHLCIRQLFLTLRRPSNPPSTPKDLYRNCLLYTSPSPRD